MIENEKITDSISYEENTLDRTNSLKDISISTNCLGDCLNKIVIGSSISILGTNLIAEDIEIYGKVEANIHTKKLFVGAEAEIIGSISCEHFELNGTVNGNIQVNGKAVINKSAQIIGSLRYQVVSIEEGASMYCDLICTKADNSLLDKILKLKKTMNSRSLNSFKDKKMKENIKNIKRNRLFV